MLRRRVVEPEWRPIGWKEPGEGPRRPFDDPDAKGWYFVGRRLYQGRKRFQISKREAARRAGISEALWRQLEAGGREINMEVFLPNPRPEHLYAVARAIDDDPALFFRAVEWDMPEGLTREILDDRLAHKITHLSERDRQVVEQLVDTLLKQPADDVDADLVPPESEAASPGGAGATRGRGEPAAPPGPSGPAPTPR
jgi:transcriptional regulator with XRE-family HTH domain